MHRSASGTANIVYDPAIRSGTFSSRRGEVFYVASCTSDHNTLTLQSGGLSL